MQGVLYVAKLAKCGATQHKERYSGAQLRIALHKERHSVVHCTAQGEIQGEIGRDMLPLLRTL